MSDVTSGWFNQVVPDVSASGVHAQRNENNSLPTTCHSASACCVPLVCVQHPSAALVLRHSSRTAMPGRAAAQPWAAPALPAARQATLEQDTPPLAQVLALIQCLAAASKVIVWHRMYAYSAL
jgi:hypothetical protein